MKNLFKKSVAIFVTVLMFACMLFTSVACDKDDGNARFVKCSHCNGSGTVYEYSLEKSRMEKKRCGECRGKGYIVE